MVSLLSEALDDPNLVQSFSGVRTSFGERGAISPAHAALAAFYGYYYGRRLDPSTPVILARDPRPSGPAICQALVRGFLAAGRDNLVDLGIITTPLAQNAVRYLQAAGGVIITASHNPLKDNGWKFLTGVTGRGPNDAPEGALLSARAMGEVVEQVIRAGAEEDDEAVASVGAVSLDDAFAALLRSGSRRVHVRAAEAYMETIASDWGLDVANLRSRTLGPVLLDPNGGAASGLNAGVLEYLGVRVYEMNAELSRPSHPIDTDSVSPDTGEHVLTRVARAVMGSGAQFGVAFDYDADRGNVVLPGTSSDAVVAPQASSALNVALSLARWEAAGRCGPDTWVVASDATSSRVDVIAEMFGARVARVETGEVNVVTRMRELHHKGMQVPVGVEGANGGTVFAGSTCRDGILTALSCALATAGDDAVQIWLRRAGREVRDGRVSLGYLLGTLPEWESLADKVQADPTPPGRVKAGMEASFQRDVWPRLSRRFEGYEFANFEGTRKVEHRTGDEAGGWRLELPGTDGRSFIFARPSRTEAGIWRLVADSPDASFASELLEIARELIGAGSGDKVAS